MGVGAAGDGGDKKRENRIFLRHIWFTSRQCGAWYDARIRSWILRLYHSAPNADARIWELGHHSTHPVPVVSDRSASNVSCTSTCTCACACACGIAYVTIAIYSHVGTPSIPISLAHEPSCHAGFHQDFIYGIATGESRASGLPGSSRSLSCGQHVRVAGAEANDNRDAVES